MDSGWLTGLTEWQLLRGFIYAGIYIEVNLFGDLPETSFALSETF